MKKVLALATCFNRKEKTIKAINSLISGNKDICFSFIICDDNSTDGTYEELQKIDCVEVIRGTGSLFWAGGMRMAMEKALNSGSNYDYFLLFNDDVDFFEHSIEKLLCKNDDIVWVGPTCDNDGKMSYGGINKKSNIFPFFEMVIGSNEFGTDCDTFNANCVLLPRDVFIKTGVFDRHYIHSMADYDYGFLLKKAGIKIKVSNFYVGKCSKNSIMNTWQDKTLSCSKRIKLKESTKGLPFSQWFYFLKKNYNIFTAILFSIKPYVDILLMR